MIPKQDENKALTDADGKRMARSVTGSIARASEGVASGSTATLDADTHRDELNKTLNVNPRSKNVSPRLEQSVQDPNCQSKTPISVQDPESQSRNPNPSQQI